MVTEEYKIACAEVLEIISYIPFIDYIKIPIKKLQLFKKYAKDEIDFSYNPELSLEEQNVSEKAKTIIALLYRDYWATPLQKEKIIAKEQNDRQKFDQEKREKYSSENLFENRQKSVQNDYAKENTMAMVEYKESIFRRIINKIKEIFHR